MNALVAHVEKAEPSASDILAELHELEALCAAHVEGSTLR